MYSLRNVITHDYLGIDYEMIWEITKNNIPQNKAYLLRIIAAEETPASIIERNNKEGQKGKRGVYILY
jgi:uncharacterized protein YutE (UPF0331/DUF86 family)